MKKLTELPDWQQLLSHFADMADCRLPDLFDADNARFKHYSMQAAGIFLDYSRNLINDTTLKHLRQLAETSDLSHKIKDLFSGAPLNTTEKRPALHSALRDPGDMPLLTTGQGDVRQLISHTQQRLQSLVKAIQSGKWRGITGKPIAHIVNVGIGGSHLGPMMTCQALKDFAVSPLRLHFLSSVDKSHLNDVWEQIDPETTVFIISSKSFSTIETLTNAKTIVSRMQALFGEKCVEQHFIAVTAVTAKARAFGIPEDHIFPLWDWVGGRYSIWSAIGLPLMLMIGNEQYEDFLSGAYEMDQHFKETSFEKNMPVILALLSIWYVNFFHSRAQAIVPYAYRLRSLVPYLQQAVMESNGKSVDLNGNPVDYMTSPIIFGEEGCNGQHTYHQLLHQGRQLVPVDFIMVGSTVKNDFDDHQFTLLASALSQAQALLKGKSREEAAATLSRQNETEIDLLAAHQAIPGNRPSNMLFISEITPKTLGALIALYEHKIFVESVIWGINPFDQWGVELGKQLLPDIVNSLQTDNVFSNDTASYGMIEHIKKMQRTKS